MEPFGPVARTETVAGSGDGPPRTTSTVSSPRIVAFTVAGTTVAFGSAGFAVSTGNGETSVATGEFPYRSTTSRTVRFPVAFSPASASGTRPVQTVAFCQPPVRGSTPTGDEGMPSTVTVGATDASIGSSNRRVTFPPPAAAVASS